MHKMRKNLQKFAKPRRNCAKMRKIVPKIKCKPNKFAQVEKMCTDSVTRITLFLHHC